MTQTAKNNLIDIQISRVASVDKAANRRTFAVIKRSQEPPDPAPPTDPPPVDPPSSREGDPVTKTATPQKPSLEGMTDDQKAYVAGLEKRSEPTPVVVHTDDDNYEEQIMKMDASDAVKQQLIKSERRAREGERIAKEERDARRTSEHVAVAKRDYSRLHKSADTLGGLMLRAEDRLEPGDYKSLQEVLKGADAQLAKGNLFLELGDGGDEAEGQTAYAELQKKADELRAADPNLSKQQAMVKAQQLHTDLAKRYQEETRR